MEPKRAWWGVEVSNEEGEVWCYDMTDPDRTEVLGCLVHGMSKMGWLS